MSISISILTRVLSFAIASLQFYPVKAGPAKAGPVATPSVTAATLVTTESVGKSIYTLTYVPSTVTKITTVTEQSTTFTVDAGAIVGIIAGGVAAGAGALPDAIPEIISGETLDGTPDEGGDDGDDGDSCKDKKTADVCEVDCQLEWYVSDSNDHSSTSCAKATCSTTTGCSVTATTKTVTTSPSATPVEALDESEIFDLPGDDPPPFDFHDMQVFLEQEFERLHISNESLTLEDTEVNCAKISSVGSLSVGVTKVLPKSDHCMIIEAAETEMVQLNAGLFCEQNKGAGVAPDKGIFANYVEVEGGPKARLEITYTESGSDAGKPSKVDQTTCENAFLELINCWGGSDNTIGGNVTLGSQVFTLEPYKPDVHCTHNDGTQSGVSEADTNNIIEEFCSKYDNQEIKDGGSESEDYLQSTGGTFTELQVAWAGNSDQCGEGKLFGDSYKIVKDTCTNVMNAFKTDCNQYRSDLKFGGTITDTCASYSMNVTSTEQLFCLSNPVYKDPPATTFKRDDALDTINNFCAKNLLVDPDAPDPNRVFQVHTNEWPEGIARYSEHGISIEVSFPKDEYGKKPYCPKDAPPQQKFKTGGDDCQRILKNKIVDDCDTNTVDKKKGGFLEDSGSNGCVEWKVVAYNFSNEQTEKEIEV